MSKRSTKTPPRAPAPRAKTSVGARSLTRTKAKRAPVARRAPVRTPPRWLAEPGTQLRGILRRVPRAAWICALVACLNAIGWSFITPPFEVPDEPDHYAYVRELAEHGRLPKGSEEIYSSEELLALATVNYTGIRQKPSTHVTVTPSQQKEYNFQLHRFNHVSTPGETTDAGVAASEPPLYYLLQTVPYALLWNGTVLDRLQAMRALSALMAGLSVLFVFMFVREALPRERWAWTVGALAAGLSPLFGFSSGGVNPDAMLFALTGALFYCLARAFRRGLTTPLAVAIGGLIATGLLTKFSFAGLVPGAFVGLILLSRRAARHSEQKPYRAPAIAAGIVSVPVLAYVARNVITGQAPFGIVLDAIKDLHGSIFAVVNYDWQLYLPHIPGTANDFPGLFTTQQIWFNGYIGRFGWLDTFFPAWVYTLALILALPIVALCLRELFVSRVALRERAAELSVYALMALGLLALVGTASYLVYPLQTDSYGQARYLLQLVPLLGLLLALAARGAGRRWGPVAGTLIVVLFLAHDLVSQLQVISRYYG